MKIRTILIVLSLLAFLSASIAGYLYYSSLMESGFKGAERKVALEAERIKNGFSAYLSQNLRDIRALAGLVEIQEALAAPDHLSLQRANSTLDYFMRALEVDVCYLMDRSGTTIASSNRNDPDSFVGENFSFRPYWKEAMKGTPATYMALGVTSKKRGVFYSHPVYGNLDGPPIGVVIIKAPIEGIEERFKQSFEGIALLVDPRGIVFISSRRDWLLHSLWELTDESNQEIAASQQFGDGPWNWLGMEFTEHGRVTDRSGKEYLIYQMEIDNFAAWKVIYLRDLLALSGEYTGPLVRAAGPIILALCILIGMSVFFLYHLASHDIIRRREAEEALRSSEERYRHLYKNTPAMLHSVDVEGRLLSVSDHWIQALGYQREEVVGRDLTDFMTEDSRRHANEIVFPDFFRKGFCSNVPYQFIRKDGSVIDIELSAIVQRDGEGNPERSLAILVDVTERNRTDKELARAQEELKLYSEDLERQVRDRTRQITNILRYTPAVVYIKDREGRYILVNPRFEELFAISNDEIRGRTDYEVFPKEVADQFRANDRRVFSEDRPQQVDEFVPHDDGIQVYLSVKFPVYDEDGKAIGVGGISTDITEMRKMQDQLKRLSDGIMQDQEKERAAFSRELHDELGQTLSALNLDAVWLWENLAEFKPDASARAEKMSRLIESAIDEVRNMATRLRPQVLDDLGLIDALEWFTRDFEQRTGIACRFSNRDVPAVNDSMATAAYRIAQEALTNVLRHSQATCADVTLQCDDGTLSLMVSDDGPGFDTRKIEESGGLGVAGMNERANLIGGTLEIRSHPGEGTTVLLLAPLERMGGEVH